MVMAILMLGLAVLWLPQININTAATCVSTESASTAATSLNVIRPTVSQLQSKCRLLDSPTLLKEIVSVRCRVMKYIPNPSRIMAATTLTTVLEQTAADPHNLSQ
jgi:hypothetical protein